MHQNIVSPYFIFNNDAYFLDFRAQKFPLIFFNLNPFYHQQALNHGVLHYEKQHKECTFKVSGRSVIFSAYYADFCLCPKSVIITTLNAIICIMYICNRPTCIGGKRILLNNLLNLFKNRRFHGRTNGNQLSVPFPLFLWAPEHVCRNDHAE